MELFFEIVRECWSAIHGGGWSELGWWSYLLLALLVATEGPVSTLLGAAAAATGILDIRYVFLFAFLGNVLGDCLWYSVGYINDVKQIHRFGSWLGIRSHHVDRLEKEMHLHAKKLIALSKLAIGLIIPTLVAAGLARVPWRRWFPLVLFIEITWTLLMVTLGFHGAGLITQLEHSLQMIGTIGAVLLIGGIIWYGRHFFAQNEASMITGSTASTEAPSTPALAEQVVYPSLADLSAQTYCDAIPVKFTTYKRNAYKQLMRRLSAARLSQRSSSFRLLTRRSTPANSATTKFVTTHPLANKRTLSSFASSPSPRTIQIHFAGD